MKTKPQRTDPPERKLNVRLLRRIQEHWREEPRRHVMSAFFIESSSQKNWEEQISEYHGDASKTRPPCGTAECIAGAANLLTGGKRNPSDSRRAAKKLGLPSLEEWDELHEGCLPHPVFLVHGWPESFRDDYKDAKTPKKRVKIACAYIDYLIAEDKKKRQKKE